MMKNMLKRLLVAAVPLVINEARKYMKNKKRMKNIQKMNMVK
ncbi:hypothetical protein [Bacillus sp. V5-8f]|nr:hypothetical protein [Bacillus sp. V5-8f]